MGQTFTHSHEDTQNTAHHAPGAYHIYNAISIQTGCAVGESTWYKSSSTAFFPEKRTSKNKERTKK